jgi:protocatechuate 3,4-dioxygenase beta subunit
MKNETDLEHPAHRQERVGPGDRDGAPAPGAGSHPLWRRRLLGTMLSLAPLPATLARSGARLALPLAAGLPVTSLAATPSCDPHAEATPRQTEGPYFTRRSPQRRSLLEGEVSGTRLVLTGQVRGLDCAALSGVLLDFWQADADGRYDNRGYRLRGHQFTDGDGRYRLETVVPGRYPGRTRHLHVKVQAPQGPVLTTQLYFAGDGGNAEDPIFSAALLMSGGTMAAQGPSGEVQAGFDFAIRTA